MKKSWFFVLLVASLCVASITAQPPSTGQPNSSNSRVVVANTMPQPLHIKATSPSPTPLPVTSPVPTQRLPVTSPPGPTSQASNLNYKGLSFSQIKSRIAEAKRAMLTRPITTAMAGSVVAPFTSSVQVAFYDYTDKKIDYITISKETFLTPLTLTGVFTTNGKAMTIKTIRANGVNTPVEIFDAKGTPHLPLLVQYPVERGGRYIETAYYMSTHPGIVTPEVVEAGRMYVHNTIEIAREQLKLKGHFIQPKIADIAERLATVEHVDHLRFRTEFHPNIYNDIFTLFALNEGQTYRYSVSSAGAGGMVQMIPATYRMVRSHFPNAALMPDFVEGMRNHVNASQAMLLYMQMTWNDLISRSTIQNALQTGIATQEQLMAAGYNSNPARLAGYIDRGGAGWTSLIPQETRIYLQIYSSFERAVAIPARKQ
jgi:hypothetical protein